MSSVIHSIFQGSPAHSSKTHVLWIYESREITIWRNLGSYVRKMELADSMFFDVCIVYHPAQYQQRTLECIGPQVFKYPGSIRKKPKRQTPCHAIRLGIGNDWTLMLEPCQFEEGYFCLSQKIDQQACKVRVLHDLCESCSSFHNAYHNHIDHRHRVFPKRHLHKLTLTYHIRFAESEHQVEEKQGGLEKR